MIDQILLHHQTKSQLKDMVKSHSHAYLFYGPRHSGKKQAALAVTAELAKEQVDSLALKNILKGEHPHVLLIGPGDGKSIKLSQIKDVLYDLNLKTFDDNLARVVIIDEAQKMTTEAANALLKSLEEPPEGTVFFLLSTSLAQVLPTIASRCQAVAFLPINESELKRQLEAKLANDSKKAEKIIDLSAGQSALAFRLAEEPDLRQKYEAAQILAKGFDEESITTRFKIAQEVTAQDEVPAFLTALVAKKRHDFLQTAGGAGELAKLLDAERYIERNVNARLVIEFLALEMRQS